MSRDTTLDAVTEELNYHFLIASYLPKDSALPEEADFIVPQAFGRNNYPDGIILDEVIRTAFVKYTTAPEVFQSLSEYNFDPGIPNSCLANSCLKLTIKRSLPLVGPWEVCYAMWKTNPQWYHRHEREVTCVWPPKDSSYFGKTRDFLLEAKSIAEERGFKIPLLVAHHQHIARVYRLARKIFGHAAIAQGQIDTFDPKSVQEWTKDSLSYWEYETLARIHHTVHGWT